MRTLEINKSTFWFVTKASVTDKKDSEGNYTGEKVTTFTSPVEIRISVYPADGKISEQLFGKDASFDLIAVSDDVVLDQFALLFSNEPSANYDSTYDYKVERINKSVNSISYGLRKKA